MPLATAYLPGPQPAVICRIVLETTWPMLILKRLLSSEESVHTICTVYLLSVTRWPGEPVAGRPQSTTSLPRQYQQPAPSLASSLPASRTPRRLPTPGSIRRYRWPRARGTLRALLRRRLLPAQPYRVQLCEPVRPGHSRLPRRFRFISLLEYRTRQRAVAVVRFQYRCQVLRIVTSPKTGSARRTAL